MVSCSGHPPPCRCRPATSVHRECCPGRTVPFCPCGWRGQSLPRSVCVRRGTAYAGVWSAALPVRPAALVFAANNVIHLLVEICLPLQHGIEVVGAVGTLLGPDDGHLENVADDHFQGLAVFFIHRQHEEGQHDEHHAHGRHAVASRTRSKKKSGTPMSAPQPKQTSCLWLS